MTNYLESLGYLLAFLVHLTTKACQVSRKNGVDLRSLIMFFIAATVKVFGLNNLSQTFYSIAKES